MQTPVRPAVDSGEDALRESYDRVPYPGAAHYMTHPNLLASLACMYGMDPPAPDRCRVLELGCGDGGNLVPMAYGLPASRFLGIDLSPVQVDCARRVADGLGLKNIAIAARSVMDMSAADGPFDYIIAHGVYSWVPAMVQDKILEICGSALAPNGVAYISYNAYPGWHFNKSMRDMMLYRTRGMTDPAERRGAALDLVDTIVEASRDGTDLHNAQMRFFQKGLRAYTRLESFLIHDYMAENNEPVYFHEFADRAGRHGLQHISDADHAAFEPEHVGPDAVDTFRQFARDPIELQQYIDFLKNTRFRRSLLCHSGTALCRDYDPARLRRLHVGTDVDPVLSAGQGIEEATAFKTTEGRKVSAEHPYARSILIRLCDERPRTVPADVLIDDTLRTVEIEGGGGSDELVGRVLYALFFNGLVELPATPRRCVATVSERPEASALARLQAPTRQVTNMRHKTIDMDDDLACLLMEHVDGTRDRVALLRVITDAVSAGRLSLPAGSDPVRLLDLHLRKMAKHALLVG